MRQTSTRILFEAAFLAAFWTTAPLFAQIQIDQGVRMRDAIDAHSSFAAAPSSTLAELADAPSLQDVPTEAILFAVDDYEGSGLGNLLGCVNDIDAAYEWLTQDLNVPPKSIQIATDKSERKGTSQNLRAMIAEAKKRKCERLFVFISCHGCSDGETSYLCPQDARGTDGRAPNDFDELDDDVSPTVRRQRRAEEAEKKRLIPVFEIFNELKDSKAREVLLILDACRDGQNDVVKNERVGFMNEFKKSFDEFAAAFKNTDKLAFAVLTSCSIGQSAREIYDPRGKKIRGAFNYFFLQGLRSDEADWGDGYDGEVTLLEAYNYARARTTRKTLDDYRSVQTPEFFSVDQRNMLLRQSAPPTTSAVDELSDLDFIVYAGGLLTMTSLNKKANAVGLKALDFALQSKPNHRKALAARGSAHRKLGNLENALHDLRAIDRPFQMYGPQTGSVALLDAPNARAKRLDRKVGADDVLTITKIQDGFCYVTEIDHTPLEADSGWIAQESTYWNAGKARTFLPASPLNDARVVNPSFGRPINVGGGVAAPNIGGAFTSPTTLGGTTPI